MATWLPMKSISHLNAASRQPVTVQADAKHVHAEPRETGDDVADAGLGPSCSKRIRGRSPP